MLNIKQIMVNMLGENCYVVSDSTREAVVIDCGAFSEKDRKQITDYISAQQLTVTHHICTHMHYDHCFGAAFMCETYHTAPEFHVDDKPIYKGMGCEIFGPMALTMRNGKIPEAARYLAEGDTVSFGQHTFTVLHTPGHTPGGICFYCEEEKAVFTGDTLFYCSVGRTDFKGGDSDTLCRSIRNKLFALPDDTIAYPGHGETTEIGFERMHNPYVLD